MAKAEATSTAAALFCTPTAIFFEKSVKTLFKKIEYQTKFEIQFQAVNLGSR